MTDKQIIINKDKFEKAENEPINQEAVNKFIEETDKFYVDDLDTRCPYHCNERIGQCNNSSQETPHTYCIDNKDCIYKQYARKKQECEELKEKLEQEKDLNKEMRILYEKFNGNSLIERRNPYGN